MRLSGRLTESRAVDLEQTRRLRRADPSPRASRVCPTVAPDQVGSRSLLVPELAVLSAEPKDAGKILTREKVLAILGHGRKATARVRICSNVSSAESEILTVSSRLTPRVQHALFCRRVQSGGFVVEGTELDHAGSSKTEAAKEEAEGRRTWR